MRRALVEIAAIEAEWQARLARAGIEVELAATIDRRDFGLDWQEQLPGGGDTLGWDVTLEALLELVEQQ